MRDEIGDGVSGAFDIMSVSAFTNDAFLYILIQTAGSRGSYAQIDLNILAGSRHFTVSFSPDEGGQVYAGEIRGSRFVAGGAVEGAVSAAAEAVEFKMPLTALGSPASVVLLDVSPMAGRCCDEPAWYSVDDIA
ncbi:MAG: hypothetical protein WCQ45_02055, partial [bacterium]